LRLCEFATHEERYSRYGFDFIAAPILNHFEVREMWEEMWGQEMGEMWGQTGRYTSFFLPGAGAPSFAHFAHGGHTGPFLLKVS
jgi:hypothetical protein